MEDSSPSAQNPPGMFGSLNATEMRLWSHLKANVLAPGLILGAFFMLPSTGVGYQDYGIKDLIFLQWSSKPET